MPKFPRKMFLLAMLAMPAYLSTTFRRLVEQYNGASRFPLTSPPNVLGLRFSVSNPFAMQPKKRPRNRPGLQEAARRKKAFGLASTLGIDPFLRLP